MAYRFRREVHGPDTPSDYFFFGDDDNDIEAVSGSLEAFVASPRSAAMETWLQDRRQRSTTENRPLEVTVPPHGVEGHDGAIYLLQQARASLLRHRQKHASYDDM